MTLDMRSISAHYTRHELDSNVSHGDPARYADPAHRAQAAQKFMLKNVDLSHRSKIENRASRCIGEGAPDLS